LSVQRLFLHVEDNIGVEVLPVDACLEVQMLSRGASGASGQCDGLSGFDCVATMYKVFEVVAVYRFQSEVMAYDDDIAVGALRLGHPYYAKDTIRSAFNGVVRMSKPYSAYGNVVVVRHDFGLETIYSHNFKNLVHCGDTVKAGQPIALTGRTGRASTEHLHFETRVNGQHFDPNIIFNMKEQTLNRQRIGCSKKGNGIVVQQLPTIYPKPLQKKYPMELFKYPNVSLHLQNVSLKERIEL
jgi:hypothetical protein